MGYTAADPYASLLNRARGAAIATFIVGAIGLLGALCFGGFGLAGTEQMLGEMVRSTNDPNVTVSILRVMLVVMAVFALLYGIVTVVLGLFIWRASSGATIAAIVIASLVLLLMLLNSLASLLQAPRMRGAQLAALGCVALVIPLLMAGYLVMLFSGLKSIKQYREAQTSYQAQYWQYHQQQQMYGQAGYGSPPANPSGPPPNEPPAPGTS
jgi:hypothetical protein